MSYSSYAVLKESLAWVKNGAGPTHIYAPSWDALVSLKRDGLIKWQELQAEGSSSGVLLISLTALGDYEYTRLSHEQKS